MDVGDWRWNVCAEVQQIAKTCDHRAEQQTKILHVDCWTSGLLVSCREGADQKTRRPENPRIDIGLLHTWGF